MSAHTHHPEEGGDLDDLNRHLYDFHGQVIPLVGDLAEAAAHHDRMHILQRLEYLRGELRAERISYGEIAELQDLAQHIGKDDVELLEPAGVPESPSHIDVHPEFIVGDVFCDRCDNSFPEGTLMLVIETDASFIGALCSEDSPWPLEPVVTREDLDAQATAIGEQIGTLRVEHGKLLLQMLRLDVREVEPTAVKVTFGTTIYDNGYFLDRADFEVTFPDDSTKAWSQCGPEDSDFEDLDDGLMADLTDAFGPFGRNDEFIVDLETLEVMA